MNRRLLVAVALFAASFGLNLYRIGGRFSNGDEVIYAEAAREMATHGDWLTMRWQGKEQLERPPTSIWPLALAYKVFGPSEAALRGVCALEAALTVALLFLMAARRWDAFVGVVAALALALSASWYLCARYIESDPLLCLFLLASLLCWEKARERPRWIHGWAFCLAGALMTKPFVGLLPLLAPLADLAEGRSIWKPSKGFHAFPRFGSAGQSPAEPSRQLDRRQLRNAVLLAMLLALPWHLYAALKFGSTFGRAFILENILRRSSQALHQTHGPAHYFLMLWHLEGPLVLIAALGLVWATVKREWLVVLWTLAVMLPFTIARSRYNHYLMPVFPALALAIALLMRALPRWRTIAATAFVAVAFVAHIVPFAQNPEGDDEIARLAGLMASSSRPDDVLFVVDQYSFSARFYASRRTIEVHMKRGWEPKSLVLPGEIVETTDFAKVVAGYPRWFAIAPRNRWAQLRSLGVVRLAGESPHYLLFTNLEQPG